jgi:hypothetical protein
MAAGMRDRLEDDAVDGGMRDAEADDLAHLVLVDPRLDRRDERDTQPLALAGRQSALLLRPQVAAPDGQVRLELEAVELEIDVRPHPRALAREAGVASQADAVRVQHDDTDPPCSRDLHELDDPWVDGGFAA